MRKYFWFGTEEVLDPMHIGSLIVLDHYRRVSEDKKGGQVVAYTWFCTSYIGEVAGVTEHRGSSKYAPDEQPEDFSSFPDYNAQVHFKDGRTVTINEGDKAYIVIPEEAGK